MHTHHNIPYYSPYHQYQPHPWLVQHAQFMQQHPGYHDHIDSNLHPHGESNAAGHASGVDGGDRRREIDMGASMSLGPGMGVSIHLPVADPGTYCGQAPYSTVPLLSSNSLAGALLSPNQITTNSPSPLPHLTTTTTTAPGAVSPTYKLATRTHQGTSGSAS